jgi:VanZ family protein
VAYAAALLVLGSLPMGPQQTAGLSDKTLHFIAFGVLAWLCWRALRELRPDAPVWLPLLGGFTASVLCGGVLELWQALLPYRSCELLDWVADALGALLAVVLTGVVWLFSRVRPSAP